MISDLIKWGLTSMISGQIGSDRIGADTDEMSDLIGSDPILMVSDPIRSDLASVTSYMIGYDSTSTILGPIKLDPPSRMPDPIGSDPISMISDPISLGSAPAAAAGIGPRSCPLTQRRLWIAIPSAPTTPGFGT